MVRIGQRVRDAAAKLCSARAAAEAAGIEINGYGHAFTPNHWDKRTQKLGYAAFCRVIDDGANPREMADNWGEAEARLRTGQYPDERVLYIPGIKPTRAVRLELQRRSKERKLRATGARVRGRYKPRRSR
jgi:hypothetical protein